MPIIMISLRKLKAFSAASIMCASLLAMLFFPDTARAFQSIYTIQTGSFQDEADARTQYDDVLHLLGGEEAEYLRIEKIGAFYTVRVGKFETYAEAERYYQKVKSRFSGALIMKAYIIDERIIEPHAGSSSAEQAETEKDSPGHAGGNGAETDEKTDVPEKSISVKETVASIADLVKEKEYNAALYIARAAVQVYPEDPELNAWTGTVLLKMDLPLEALKYLKKAVELSPDVADYHNGVGYSWFFLKKYKEALQEFDSAVSLEPGHVDALSGLCMVYAETGDKGKALELYNKVKYLDEETSEKLLNVIEPQR